MGQSVQASMFTAVRVLVRTRKSRAARGGDTSVWMGWAGCSQSALAGAGHFGCRLGRTVLHAFRPLLSSFSPIRLLHIFSPSTFCQALTHTPPSRKRRRARKRPTQREPVCCCARNRLLFLCRPCPPVASLSDTNPSSAGQPPSRTLQPRAAAFWIDRLL